MKKKREDAALPMEENVPLERRIINARVNETWASEQLDALISIGRTETDLQVLYFKKLKLTSKQIIQDNCKHDKGYKTNTGVEPSKCIECGKPWGI